MRNLLAIIGIVAIALVVGVVVGGGGLPSLSPVGTEERSIPVPNVVESVRAQTVWEGASVDVVATPSSECTREIFGVRVGGSEDTGTFIGEVEAEIDLSTSQITANGGVGQRVWTVRVEEPQLQPARIDPDLSVVDHDRSGWSCGGKSTVELWQEAEDRLDEAARETDAVEIARESFTEWVTDVITAGEPEATVEVEFVPPAILGA